MNGSINTNQPSAEKKKNGRFNFIDFVLIVLAITVIGTLIYVFSPVSLIKNWINKDTRMIEYQVEFTNVDVDFIDSIKEENTVIDAVSKNNLGTVKTCDANTKYIEYKVSEDKTSDEDGNEITEYKLVPVEYPDRYNVIVTITAAATFEEGEGFIVNSRRIAVGEKLSLKFPDFIGEGYCIRLSEI